MNAAWQQAFAAAKCHGIEEEMEFVDQIVFEQRVHPFRYAILCTGTRDQEWIDDRTR